MLATWRFRRMHRLFMTVTKHSIILEDRRKQLKLLSVIKIRRPNWLDHNFLVVTELQSYEKQSPCQMMTDRLMNRFAVRACRDKSTEAYSALKLTERTTPDCPGEI